MPTVAAAATGAVPVSLPRGTAAAAAGKKDAPAVDFPDAPKAEPAGIARTSNPQ